MTAVRRAWFTTVANFLLHGLIVATWVARIPAIQSRTGLNSAAFGLALLGSSLGSVLAIPLCGFLVTKFGSARITLAGCVGFCAALIPMGLATGAPTLSMALFFFGAMAGTTDVAMNVQAVEVEKALGRPTMSRFHAMWSLGGMMGAALGGAVAARSVAPVLHFAVIAVSLAVLCAFWAPGMLDTHGGVSQPGSRLPFRDIPPALLAICAICFCLLVSEGAMADWVAIYLRDVMKAGPGMAASGYTVFSAAMCTFRLIGDSITHRLGPVRTVRYASLLAAAGVLLAIGARSVGWALPGFAAAGAGFSVIVPLAYGAGGRVPGVSPGAGVATVTGIGYVGFLLGPPLIGFTAQAFSLRAGLGIIGLFSLVATVLAAYVEPRPLVRKGSSSVPRL